MSRNDAVHHVYKAGKAKKKMLQPRAARHLGHPHPLSSGYDLHRHPMPDSGATRVPKPSMITRKHPQMVERNLELLAEDNPAVGQPETVIYAEKMELVRAQEESGAIAPMTPGRRAQFVALETHREMASEILGAGGTFEEAADHAGVSRATVAKWYAEEDFRRRVDEQRSVVRSKVGGRIEQWMDRRTSNPDELDKADPKVTLAIYDRISAGPGRAGQGSGQQQPTNVNVILTYADLMERSARAASRGPATAEGDVVDAGGQSRGFPLIGPGSVPLAGDRSQQD